MPFRPRVRMIYYFWANSGVSGSCLPWMGSCVSFIACLCIRHRLRDLDLSELWLSLALFVVSFYFYCCFLLFFLCFFFHGSGIPYTSFFPGVPSLQENKPPAT